MIPYNGEEEEEEKGVGWGGRILESLY